MVLWKHSGVNIFWQIHQLQALLVAAWELNSVSKHTCAAWLSQTVTKQANETETAVWDWDDSQDKQAVETHITWAVQVCHVSNWE